MADTEWTILVFLNAKNNLEAFAFPNFLQMASVDGGDKVKILVEMGRPQQHFTKAYGAWSKVLRFAVAPGMQPVESSAIQDMGSANMGDIATLVDFVKWGREKYPAKRTMLVIWNHGQGWRAPLDDEPPGTPAKPADELAGGYRYVSNDDDTGDKLFNREIQDGLGALLGKQQLDVIAFDACLMSMVETAYAFRRIAKVLVASQELEPGSGWDYTRWLKPLIDAKGAWEAPELGNALVKAMADQYGDLEATTLAATSLGSIDDLANAISLFAAAATQQLSPDTVEKFRTARAKCTEYARGYGMSSIDLKHFMEQIIATDLDATLRVRAKDVITAHDAAILSAYASKQRKGDYGSNGLAIYFPATAAAHDQDPDGAGYDADNDEFPVEFVQKEKWAAFLRAYWDLVP